MDVMTTTLEPPTRGSARSRRLADHLVRVAEAATTPYLPSDKLGRARVLQWLFFEQYSHEPYVAVARFLLRHTERDDPRRSMLEQRQKGGYAALGVMERHLADTPFFVGGRYSIADIALYAYTHVADQGGFELSSYPCVRAWLARVEAQPGYERMLPKRQGT